MNISLCLALFLAFQMPEQGTKVMTLEDMMAFRKIEKRAIEPGGTWMGYLSTPGRGDSEAVLRATEAGTTYRIPRAVSFKLAPGGAWAAVEQGSDAKTLEKLSPEEKKKLKNALVLVELATGKETRFERVQQFAFAEGGQWIGILHWPEDAPPAADAPKPAKKDANPKDEARGGQWVLRNLGSDQHSTIPNVVTFAFSGKGGYVAFAQSTKDGAANQLVYRNLNSNPSADLRFDGGAGFTFPQLAWDEEDRGFAWLQGSRAETDLEKRTHQLKIWDAKTGKTQTAPAPAATTYLHHSQTLRWSKDGLRLFYATRTLPPQKKESKEVDLFSVDQLLEKASLDVWHSEDPRIKTQEKTEWEKWVKRGFAHVFHVASGSSVALSSAYAEELLAGTAPQVSLLTDEAPYLKATSWSYPHKDLYVVEHKSGRRTKVAENIAYNEFTEIPVSLSPNGAYVAFFKDGKPHLYDVGSGKTRILEASVSFTDAFHDQPGPAPAHGFVAWVSEKNKDLSVLVNDQYDIWSFSTQGGAATCLTAGEGRQRKVTFRAVNVEEDKEQAQTFAPKQKILLLATHELEKHTGFYQAEIGSSYVVKRLEDLKTYMPILKAKKADKLIYSRQDFREFPDLWVADSGLNAPMRLSTENPKLGEFALGEPQLVTWRTADGDPIQGVLILPGNYDKSKRYPVLVYFYERFSDRLYQFNPIEINHRPNFGFYSSNGYAVFLPDIRYELGRPGQSAVKSLVPGVQKLIDMGVADPKRIGLHGHSWSGYQTAYVITQTNLFAAAIAGAPVANMTSAYGGIRLESGKARQFQYEVSQSRLGPSLWERRDLYIENSPLFYVDRIQTPLLIQFGDADEAVPWAQGVELYLAMRRLGKYAVFLQYHGEPHHLKKYPNKVDYTLKMKAFFDHYLKGEPAPAWMTEGVPYSGGEAP